MDSFVRNHASAVTLSVLLHVLLVTCLLVSVNFSSARSARAPQPSAIEAVMLDQSLLENYVPPLRDAEPEPSPETIPDPAIERERLAREAAEQIRLSEEREAVRLEQERQAQLDLERQRAEAELVAREQAEREDAERVAAEQQRLEEEARLAREAEEARREQERLAEAARLEEQRQREDEARRVREAQEARERAASEAELLAALAAEEELRQARNSGAFDLYLRQIQSAIERAWSPPQSARAGIECVVNVTQIPSGDVTGVSIGQCNGDTAVQRSIEAAVLRASPLPTPSNPVLFDRNLQVVFRPDF